MLKQLSVQGLKIDEISTENINKITQMLHAQGDIQKLHVLAPAAGVVLLPTKTDNSESEIKKIGKGDQVKQGDVLAVIGDTSGLMVRVNVSEFNINQLKVGQKVKVTGAAFPDTELQGEIAGLDKQAQINSSGMPVFPVEVIVPKLTAAQQAMIHMGMSAKVEVSIDSGAKITVPIDAVKEKTGASYVNVKDQKSGKIRAVAVTTGATTLDSVVIESNLVPGDQVVITR